MAVEFSVHSGVYTALDIELVECAVMDAVCIGFGVDWGFDHEGLSGW